MEETASRINDMIVRSKAELGMPETVPYDIVVSIDDFVIFFDWLFIEVCEYHRSGCCWATLERLIFEFIIGKTGPKSRIFFTKLFVYTFFEPRKILGGICLGAAHLKGRPKYCRMSRL